METIREAAKNNWKSISEWLVQAIEGERENTRPPENLAPLRMKKEKSLTPKREEEKTAQLQKKKKKKKGSRCSRNLSHRHAVCVVSTIISLHQRVQASSTNDPNFSPDCSYFTQASVEKINIYCYI